MTRPSSRGLKIFHAIQHSWALTCRTNFWDVRWQCKIRQELHDPNTYYAILADEYKYMSKLESVAVCVCYFHAGVIKERAIRFMNTSDLTAAGISEKILQLLEPLELDPLLCVGLCFDGAAVMSGNHGGVHVILKRTFPNAIYIHCCSHRLNLVLCKVASASGHVGTFFEIWNSLHAFTTRAPRHAIFLEIQKEIHPDRQPLETTFRHPAGAPEQVQ